MTASFGSLLPGLRAPVEAIAQTAWIRQANETVWIFALIETAHLVFLAILGGAVFLLNLRLLGAILRDIPAVEVERRTRPWLHASIGGTIVTGVLMAIATVTTLLPNPAFFVKIVALGAAILFSLAVARQVRRGDAAATSATPKRLAVAALVLWSAALWLFAATPNLIAGFLLVAFAGFALFAVFIVSHRRSYAIGLILIAASAVALLGIDPPAWAKALPFVAAFGLAGTLTLVETRHHNARRFTPLRLSAFSSTLAWITVAAAGRWIGFS